jgi:hypothetical protein
MRDRFKPGQIWLDTEGKRIQAHGGRMIIVEDTYYWYGENKEKTVGTPDIWHWGVRCYSSKDLYNWKDEGIIIPPEPDNPSSPLHPSSMMDRPHIIYNKKTKKYVAWLKIMCEPPAFAILTADTLLGPYTMVNPKLYPCGLSAGDFDIDVDEKTGTVFLFSEDPHTKIYSVALNEDYTDVQGDYAIHFPSAGPPENREAPAHFYRNGLHYLITSGTTGFFPNPSEASVSESWDGPYTIQGDPHVNDASRTSFNSQISCIFRHPAREDLYIAMADRWLPDLPQQAGESFYNGEWQKAQTEKFKKIFDPNVEFFFTEEDAKNLFINSSISDYVWLPLRFEGNIVRIDWLDEWKVEDFK